MKQEFTGEDTLAVKGMAVLTLLFCHLFDYYERVAMLQVNSWPLSLKQLLVFNGFGHVCVAVFAFLSAYGIAKGIKNKEKKCGEQNISAMYRQALKRYLKLMAHFLFMFAGVNLLWFSKFDYAAYGTGLWGILYGLLDAFGLSGICKTPSINPTWWYMELAILIIFVVPLLYLAIKKMGNYTVLLGLLLPVVVDLRPDVKRYYLVILFGVMTASKDWFEKLFSARVSFWMQAIVGGMLLTGCILTWQSFMDHGAGYLVDAPGSLFFSWFVARLMAGIAGVGDALRFLGKHSMNIYFMHTFIYLAIYQDFIYSFRYAALIHLVLLACSLSLSLALEGLKKLLSYEKFLAWALKKI